MNPYYRRKTPLVIDGTRTQVLAESMAIAADALNHWATNTVVSYKSDVELEENMVAKMSQQKCGLTMENLKHHSRTICKPDG